MEDKIWRIVYSTVATILFFLVFVGAYFAGQNGWWWLGLIFVVVVFLTVFSLVAPHDD